LQFAFCSLDKLSPDYEKLNTAVKDRLVAKMKTLSPNLATQYEIMLSRIEDSIPSCELMLLPGAGAASQPDPTKKVHIIIHSCRIPLMICSTSA
jgi:hypothetical protein